MRQRSARNSERSQKFTSAGSFVKVWGSSGFGNGQFRDPIGIAISHGSVYVADYTNSLIQKFTTSGTFIRQWGDLGSLGLPYGLDADDAGNVYVTDVRNFRVVKYTEEGAELTQWGSAGNDPGEFVSPANVATDGAGNIYVAESSELARGGGNHRVQKFGSIPTETRRTTWSQLKMRYR